MKLQRIDFEILEWILENVNAFEWYFEDVRGCYFAKRNEVEVQLLGGDFATKQLVLLDKDDGSRYVIKDPEPISAAPVGKFKAFVSEKFFRKEAAPKTEEEKIEYVVHARLSDILSSARSQVAKREKNLEIYRAKVRVKLFAKLRG